jgi:NAD(P)-dependent dehydrogenase (short-subunit alcohol dehydrogenase family)
VFEAAGMGDILTTTAASLPLGRMAHPDDVARVVLFCASDLATLMTGSTLAVDAGALTL